MNTIKLRDEVLRALHAQDAIERGELPLRDELEYVPDPPIRVRVGKGHEHVCSYSCDCEVAVAHGDDEDFAAFCRGYQHAGHEGFILGLLAGLSLTLLLWGLR